MCLRPIDYTPSPSFPSLTVLLMRVRVPSFLSARPWQPAGGLRQFALSQSGRESSHKALHAILGAAGLGLMLSSLEQRVL